MEDHFAHYSPTTQYHISRVQSRLQQPLPGLEAQVAMMSRTIRALRPPEKEKHLLRNSAAMITLVPESETVAEWQIILTLRSNNVSNHKGQISLPGGRCDEGETSSQTALRETYEEIGIAPSDIQVLGGLTPLYVSPSKSLITPIIGIYSGALPLVFTPSEFEVEEIFSVSFADLLNEGNKKHQQGLIPNTDWNVPYWDVHPTVPLWGATAMMLSECVQIFQKEFNL
jgi:8-oxo-dGTP pyrophosphatase MutT (NUDIX family)